MAKYKQTFNQALFEILELGEHDPIIFQNSKKKKLAKKTSKNNKNGNIMLIVPTCKIK